MCASLQIKKVPPILMGTRFGRFSFFATATLFRMKQGDRVLYGRRFLEGRHRSAAQLRGKSSNNSIVSTIDEPRVLQQV